MELHSATAGAVVRQRNRYRIALKAIRQLVVSGLATGEIVNGCLRIIDTALEEE